MEPIVVLDKLTKRFKSLTAVDHISFEIQKGEIFGLLGPNGAGKSTTIKMLCTLLDPTDGNAAVAGHDIRTQRDEVRQSIGVVFQDPSIDDELTAYENMFFHGRIYGLPKSEIIKRTASLLKLVELEDKAGKLVREFSGGMKRRLEIARGLMHHPTVLFLDEPTIGLDPQTRTRIWGHINEMKKEGVTIILTTHYMEEADRLCTRLAIIDKGKVIAIGTPDELKETLGGDTITIGTDNPKAIHDALRGEKSITKMTRHDGSCTINIPKADEKVPMIFRIAEKHKIEIRSISLHKPTLEDVFLHFTGRRIREESPEGFTAMVRMMRRR